MDLSAHHLDHHQIPPTPSSSRKRSRENETPSQRHKREKAAERQRHKRKRDREKAARQNDAHLTNTNILALSQVPPGLPPVEPQQEPVSIIDYQVDDLSLEDLQKRDRVRAAARERQRKHRALVKARKLRELGLDMGNEIIPGIDDVQYRITAEGHYQPIMPHEMQQQPPHGHPMHEPPFPQGQAHGGQTFASTLLLSFSCAPLLKQHLLRTLSMTNEELASLEPIIAQAWDHWDQQRRMHFAHQAAAAQKAPDGSDPGGAPYPMGGEQYLHDPSQAPPNDFRARFHRPLVAPSPFRSSIVGEQQGSTASASSTSASLSATVSAPVPPGDSLEAHLSSAVSADQRQGMMVSGSSLDPQLGQARDEAAGVAGKLERT